MLPSMFSFIRASFLEICESLRGSQDFRTGESKIGIDIVENVRGKINQSIEAKDL